MEWIVEHRGDHVRVATRGAFDVDDHRRMVEDIVTREYWAPGTAVLFDHRDMRFGNSGYEQMRAAAGNHLAHDDRIGGGKAAIVMGTVADYGSGRQFELLTDGRVQARLRIFLDPAEALAWLLD